MVDVNLKGVIYGSHAAVRRFIAQGHGTLVNMGSVESEVPLAYHGAYAATKAGVLSLGRSLNEELRHAGHGKAIKVATVMPWAVDTTFFQHTANNSGRADRMAMTDGPEKVVQALVWVSLHPREELPVGVEGAGGVFGAPPVPGPDRAVSANIHRAELAKGTPQAPTSGSLHQPMAKGRAVEGGVRARMKREDEAAEAGTAPLPAAQEPR